MKYLRIIEYSPLGKIPLKEDKEFEFKYKGNIFRTKVLDKTIKEEIRESIDPFYNDSIVSTETICLNDAIIYDDLDIDDNQKIAYVFECPICMHTTITSNENLDFCPQCENVNFPLNLIALVNTDQMENIAIENKENTKLIVIKNGKIEILDKKESKNE